MTATNDSLVLEHTYLEGRILPHAFRHTFATLVLEKTGDLAATQDLLGHASPSTTRIYAKLANDRLRKIHQRVFTKS